MRIVYSPARRFAPDERKVRFVQDGWNRLMALRDWLASPNSITVFDYAGLAIAPPPSAIEMPAHALEAALHIVPRTMIERLDDGVAFYPIHGPEITICGEVVKVGTMACALADLRAALSDERSGHPAAKWMADALVGMRLALFSPSQVLDMCALLGVPAELQYPHGLWLWLLDNIETCKRLDVALSALHPRDLRRWRVSPLDEAALRRYGRRLANTSIDAIRRTCAELSGGGDRKGNCPLFDADGYVSIAFRRGKHKMAVERVLRDVHAFDVGRLCPLSSSEGENIGRQVGLAERGDLHPAGYLVSDDDDEVVVAQHAGRALSMPRAYCPPFPEVRAIRMPTTYRALFGKVANRLPFIVFDDPTRALMACNMARQALRLVNPRSFVVLCEAELDDEMGAAMAESQTTALVAYCPIPAWTFEDAVAIGEEWAASGEFSALKDYTYTISSGALRPARWMSLLRASGNAGGAGVDDGSARSARPGDLVEDGGELAFVGPQGRGDVPFVLRHHGLPARLLAIECRADGLVYRLRAVVPPAIGDKLSGTHGNKGVISALLPSYHTPQLPDGRRVDACFSPVSILSRNNFGQLYEAHLGWASYVTGRRYIVAHDDARLLRPLVYGELAKAWGLWMFANFRPGTALAGEEIRRLAAHDIAPLLPQVPEWAKEGWTGGGVVRLRADMLEGARCAVDTAMRTYAQALGASPLGEATLEGWVRWGRALEARSGWPSPLGGRMFVRPSAGEPFLDRPVVVGLVRVMRLNHLAAEKRYGRATGRYNISQMQPARGRRQGGGQRVGEMEMWALMAHGADAMIAELTGFRSDYAYAPGEVYISILDRGDSGNLEKETGMARLRSYFWALGLDVTSEA